MAVLRLGARLASGVAHVFARGYNLVFSAGNLWRERESLVSCAEVARPSFIELSARFLCVRCFRRFLKFEDRARVFALTKMAALRLGARLASGVAHVFARGYNLVFSAGNLWRERESLVSCAEVARPSFIELSARFHRNFSESRTAFFAGANMFEACQFVARRVPFGGALRWREFGFAIYLPALRFCRILLFASGYF